MARAKQEKMGGGREMEEGRGKFKGTPQSTKGLRLSFLGGWKQSPGRWSHSSQVIYLMAELELQFRFQTHLCITPPWSRRVGLALAKRWNARKKMELTDPSMLTLRGKEYSKVLLPYS